MHEQWEYKTIWGPAWGTFPGRRFNKLRDAEGTDWGPFGLKHVDGMLNDLGGQGWEVCSVTFSLLCPFTVALKRRIAPA
jgi:hypothetical protein